MMGLKQGAYADPGETKNGSNGGAVAVNSSHLS